MGKIDSVRMSKDTQIQDDGSEIMERLATRVRAARSALGLSRRALSERSGVSPRYLAQIEAGEGNISVILLDRSGAEVVRYNWVLGWPSKCSVSAFDAESTDIAMEMFEIQHEGLTKQ